MLKIFYLFIVLGLSGLIAPCSFAQTATPTPANIIAGTVNLESGSPLKGAIVTGVIYDESGVKTISTMTNASGNFSHAASQPGLAYSLSIRKYGYSFTPGTIAGTTGDGQNHSIVAVPYPLMITGMVKKDGIALAGVTVNGGALGEVMTGDDGTFVFTDVPYGTRFRLTFTLIDHTFLPSRISGSLTRSRSILVTARDSEGSDQSACSDGRDNDGDGLADYPEDPGCSSNFDISEVRRSGPQCDDGIDNNGNGIADMYDPDCTGPDDITEGDGLPHKKCRTERLDYEVDSALSHLESLTRMAVNHINSLLTAGKKESARTKRSIKGLAKNAIAKLNAITGAAAARMQDIPRSFLTCSVVTYCQPSDNSPALDFYRESLSKVKSISGTALDKISASMRIKNAGANARNRVVLMKKITGKAADRLSVRAGESIPAIVYQCGLQD